MWDEYIEHHFGRTNFSDCSDSIGIPSSATDETNKISAQIHRTANIGLTPPPPRVCSCSHFSKFSLSKVSSKIKSPEQKTSFFTNVPLAVVAEVFSHSISFGPSRGTSLLDPAYASIQTAINATDSAAMITKYIILFLSKKDITLGRICSLECECVVYGSSLFMDRMAYQIYSKTRFRNLSQIILLLQAIDSSDRHFIR